MQNILSLGIQEHTEIQLQRIPVALIITTISDPAYNKTVGQTTANRVIQVFFVSDKGDSVQHVPVDYGETLQTQIEEKHTIHAL